MAGRALEIILRCGAVVCGAGALVAGCIAVNKKLGLNDFLKIPVSDELENNTNASVALVIIGTIVAAIVEILFIVIRFAASGVSFNKILMLLDVSLTILLGATFGAAGVIGAIATQDWSDLVENTNGFISDYVDIRDPLAATAACALAAALLLILLLVWMVLSLIFHKKIFNYSQV